MLKINKIFNVNNYQNINFRRIFSNFLEKSPLKDVFESSTIDILSKGKYPSNVLSNFYESKFVFEGVQINSMEGLLQSLKTPDKEKQIEICLLIGKEAKKAGENLKAQYDGKSIYWQGKVMDRFSKEYQDFLKMVYNAKFQQDETFRKALGDAKGKRLIHSIGKQNVEETILTEKEFIENLERLQN